MEFLRICYTLKLLSGGLWGSVSRGLEADIVTSSCRHASGEDIPCIHSTYIKGLLRRSLEYIEDHLYKFGVIGVINIVKEIFGPLTPFEDEAQGVASNIVIAPLFPMKNESSAIEICRDKPLSYLSRIDVIAKPELYIEPHIRIDDRVGTVSIGGLYSELKVVPQTLFYGEIIFYTDSEDKALEVARALSIAIASLRTQYAGRRTVVQPKILSITYRGINMAKDDIVGMVIDLLNRGSS